MAEQFEKAYLSKLTEAQARKVISDIYNHIHGDPLNEKSVADFLVSWLKTKKKETTSGTFKRYENAADKLRRFLGDRVDKDVAYVQRRDIESLRDQISESLSASTANTDLKILRIAFGQAIRDGLRLDNPAKAVPILKIRKDESRLVRRPFTADELQKLMAVATGEWRGLILAGLYIGQRLGDNASIRWRMIDMDSETICNQPGQRFV